MLAAALVQISAAVDHCARTKNGAYQMVGALHDPAHRYDWKRLNRHQLGKYAEYLTKMEFVLHGCDVFTCEVDTHGIDFVVRTPEGNHYDIQVKSFRLGSGITPYVYLEKAKFRIHPHSVLALVKFLQGEAPKLFLVRSYVGVGPNPIFVSRDYGGGKKSPPEWGLTLSKKNLALLLKECEFHTVVRTLV